MLYHLFSFGAFIVEKIVVFLYRELKEFYFQ